MNVDGKCILSPWDENLAKELAVVNKIVPFTRYERDYVKATSGLLKLLKVPGNAKVEIPKQERNFLHWKFLGKKRGCRSNLLNICLSHVAG